jgi:mannose-6-phosphate isomerase-like protein (cupin superfamily)
MDTGISVTRLDHDSPERFVALRRSLGVTGLGMNQIVLQPGQRGRIHAHEHQEEIYVVMRGTLTLEVDGVAQDLGVDDVVRVGPEVRRRLVNRGPGPCSLLALGASGEHQGRDGLAYADWTDADPRPPQEIPLPDDLPRSELRPT